MVVVYILKIVTEVQNPSQPFLCALVSSLKTGCLGEMVVVCQVGKYQHRLSYWCSCEDFLHIHKVCRFEVKT